MTTVWIVSLEWNSAPAEVTGETGIMGVFDNEPAARACQRATQQEHHDAGTVVYEFPEDDKPEETAWEIDVHCTEHAVQTAA